LLFGRFRPWRFRRRGLCFSPIEVKKRATRPLGELMKEQPKAKGAREPGTKRGSTRGQKNPASFKDQGVDKNLAKAARKAASLTEDQFEKSIEEGKNLAVAAASGDQAIVRAARDSSAWSNSACCACSRSRCTSSFKNLSRASSQRSLHMVPAPMSQSRILVCLLRGRSRKIVICSFK
jgi:hypothetical protein